MPLRHSRRLAVAATLLGGLAAPWGTAAAQDAACFSPTYAVSQGSPYSAVYARAFGAAPLETAAAAPAAGRNIVSGPLPGAIPEAVPEVVYVIENGRLLTYSADDYARGQGEALAASRQASDPAGGRLYGAVPPRPGPDEAPIPLLPQDLSPLSPVR